MDSRFRTLGRISQQVLDLTFSGRAHDAMPLVERAQAGWPAHPWPDVLRALVCIRLKRAAEARVLMRRAVAARPGDVAALVALGDACAALARLEEAIRAYEAAAPDAASAMGRYVARHHARVLTRLERHDEALALLDRARAAAPEGDVALEVERGWRLVAADRLAEAGAVAEAAAARWPDDRGARRLVYETRSRTKPAHEVGAELDRALAMPAARDNAALWVVRARRAHECGDWVREAESWLTAYALEPGDAHARRQAGFAYRRAGLRDRAIACLEPEFLADPTDVFVRSCLLGCLRYNNDEARAIALLNRAIRAHPHVRALLGVRRKLLKQLEVVR